MPLQVRIPWVIKYRPRKIDEYINQDEAKTVLTTWIREWQRKTPSKKAVLLHGPPGTGKTSLVEAIANEYNMEIVEMNASDFRRKEDIERIAVRAATQYSLTGKKRIILLDEVDGLSGSADKGAIEAIIKLINVTIHPVILTANNPWHPDLRPLRDIVIMVQFKRLRQRDVIGLLKRICEKEGINCEDKALKIIHDKNNGDLRACINDLQAIAETYGRVTETLAMALVYYRDRELDPFETLRSIFTARYSWQSKNAVTHSQLDPDMLTEWLSENIPVQLTDPEDMYRAYQVLSRAGVYKGRIIRTNSWDLLAYIIDMLGPAMTQSRKKTRFKWTAYKFPQKIRMLAETKRARELLNSAAKKIGNRLHSSKSTVIQEYIPLLRILYQYQPEKTILIMKEYNLTPDEAQVITGDKKIREEFDTPLETLREKAVVTKKTKKASQKRRRTSEGQTTLF